MDQKYRVIIADDEERICALLKSSIHWNQLPLELTAICHNGLDLKEKIFELTPDILVTDICMPGKNAIDLIKEIRAEGNQTKILLVSGYRRFEYAKEALKYGVDNYLLKPIDEDELNEALEKLCIEIDVERHSLSIENKAMMQGTLHNFFARDIKSGHLMELGNSLELINKEYCIDFQEGKYRVFVLKIDIMDETAEKTDLQLIRQKIKDFCEKAFLDMGLRAVVSILGGRIVFTLNYVKGQNEDLRGVSNTILEKSMDAVSLFESLAVTVGAGKEALSLDGLKRSLEEADAALVFRIGSMRNRVYLAEDWLNEPKEEYLGSEERKLLIHSLDPWNETDFLNAMTNIEFCHTFNTLDLFKALEETIQVFENAVNHYDNPNINLEGMINALLEGMDECRSRRGMVEFVKSGLLEIMNSIWKERKKAENQPVADAKDYVKNHYGEKIYLDDVACKVGLNAAYFSSLFKKQEGITFTDYINDYRIQVSKELLRSGKYSVAQVCDMAGIGNQRYFSKIFKEKVGVKPTEYRKLYN